MHQRSIQSLAIELLKMVHSLSPDIMNEVFVLKSYQLYYSDQPFVTRNVRTVYNGMSTIAFLGPEIWALLPPDIKKRRGYFHFQKEN